MLSTHTEQYHIKATAGQTGGYCILPGDPGRCEKIVSHLQNPVHVGLNREFNVWNEIKAEDSVCIIEENTKISDGNKAKLKNVMAELNKYIGSKNELLDNRYHLDLGDEYALGGAYFVHFAKYADEEQPQEMLWGNHLHIILNEYLRGHRDRHAILTCLKNVFDSAWNGSLQ